MKGKTLVSPLALGLLTLSMLITPALAQYNVTLTLIGPTGKTLCTKTFEDVDNMTLKVPEPLWLLINATQGTTTFTAPFSVSFPLIGAGIITLEADSAPEGWTVTFEPRTVPDLNDDGCVDIYDLVTVARSVTVSVGPPENYDMFLDLNFDLTIDVFDLVKVAKHIEITI